jgi:4-hydroxybenzoate polyprenyltransferase
MTDEVARPRRAPLVVDTARMSTQAQPARRGGHSLARSLPVLLVRAAHPRQALATAAAMGVAAGLAGRPLREIGLVAATVLVGQAVLGWDNDLVDRERDARHERPGKPVAQGLLEAGTVWFTLACALLLVVPLAVSAGTLAGASYLLALAVGLLGDRVLRGSVLSWLPWAVQFALYPAYLAYGGWGGVGTDTPPTIAMTALAALLGVCVHVLRALPGLVADNQDGRRHLPLRIALRTGAPRLLVLTSVLTGLVVVAMLVVGQAVGLT